ncbi:MAG: hypothetical protein FP810_00445 [Desulfocapsa sp.]|jgi:uncharacterized protein (TIGR02186 family)|nr:hypothetical protein [Desulfocapsa sp.]
MYTEKNIMKRVVYGLLTVVLVSLAWFNSSMAAEGPLLLELAKTNIKISTFYNGTTLDVAGSLPADEDVVVQLSGPKKDVHLKEKGKVAGFLWMNKTDVSLENTPAVYMVYTPTGSTADKFLNPDLGVGYQALVKDITSNPESADKTFIFGEYVKLMEKSGVYAINEGTVKYGEPNDGMKSFIITLTIPSKMSAGTYKVAALAMKDGVVTSRVTEDLTLELSGLPAAISSMAYGRPLLFGFMAVFIAVGAGLLVGVLFRGGGGAH